MVLYIDHAIATMATTAGAAEAAAAAAAAPWRRARQQVSIYSIMVYM